MMVWVLRRRTRLGGIRLRSRRRSGSFAGKVNDYDRAREAWSYFHAGWNTWVEHGWSLIRFCPVLGRGVVGSSVKTAALCRSKSLHKMVIHPFVFFPRCPSRAVAIYSPKRSYNGSLE
jgi:hypothetical protein